MKYKSELTGWFAGLLRNRLVLAGALILSLLVVAAVTAPLWVKAGLLRDPVQQFLAGTDNLGRDVFSRVLFGHGLRNAMIPVVPILGMDMAGLLGGVMFVENVFALPGLGTLAVQRVFNLDVPVIMGTVMFSAVIVVAANLVVDVLYRWIEPRIKAAA